MRVRFKTAFWRRRELMSLLRKNSGKLGGAIIMLVSIVSILLVVYEVGFDLSSTFYDRASKFYLFAYVVFFINLVSRFFNKDFRAKGETHYITWGLFALLFFLLIVAYLKPDEYIRAKAPLLGFLKSPIFTYVFLMILSVMELSRSTFGMLKKQINTSLIFVLSFFIFIIIGTGLLLLPNSTTNGISLVDAIFTSTSAVCVTGLTVVDTGTAFTTIGQLFLLMLIQIGGIGVMTLTSFFGYFMMDNFSFKNQINLGNFINEDNVNQIFETLMKIVFVTLSIEAIGAVFVYISVKGTLGNDVNEVYYSVFHTISAFCNSGFSTFNDNLFDIRTRYNYMLHTNIAFLVILGGIGFPILFNFIQLINHFLRNLFRQITGRQSRYHHRPKIINLHTKLVVYTTLILLVFGTLFFFLFEHNNTLKELPWYGKVVESFFGSVTPRSAGFNTVSMGAILPYTILLTMFLMWVGASPVSTGGGIKTSTFAVAVLTVVNIARGKERLEIGGREVTNMTVLRAFGAILLSILLIGISTSLIKIFEPDIDMLSIAFESISALSTAGLSLGITANLDDYSKIVLIATMFVGRVGALTFLSGLVRHKDDINYKYPKESIFVN